ncbi:nicotinate-nucleotide--dimethylbenzimidazole phosphoribosyltransferase [Antarcticimicrobium sediminis]|uniref:Nicotinate-nucleotide--dimethylbenzimidazole phosphoribosyltransferase n=1 Tax=Antarcticimicrobium sediminis TaxID=2546227 RepID=A0A4R5F0U5_9RHOB|nr:nicotinate-nucleotide--dimethylbenzimidazole phosphoribosyltransferase [Antarcticimicrobium sediminis]TDE40892.1 nicotinate-nucleotide--dimethylbenzimidazole phosphoribosyltransferase [Antarcticimicrobium sediminis]
MLPEFNDLDQFRAVLAGAPEPDTAARAGAEAHNSALTKPPGALGRLEELAIWYAGWRGEARPQIVAPQVIVFAGNHGVTAQGISAFPADVTVQMVANFKAGGAAINQLAQAAGAQMDVVALELDRPTADFTQGPAMTKAELVTALRAGWAAVDRDADLLVVGEMGIGNTTSAAALCRALYGGTAEDWTGPGTGLDAAGVAHKARIVEQAVALHKSQIHDGLDALACLGGREIAAMSGAIAAARMRRIPVLLDGFICCAAAACLASVNARALDHALAGHQSAEFAHPALLARLGLDPLLSLGMRLGEGSGAALAIPVLRGALACHSGMATFAEAGISAG